ncbi:glutamine synthetase III [Candidatus Saccharibacteria bacterium]|nr:glutamine synthetase III [Candidatus Saccharibacteria bacterium]
MSTKNNSNASEVFASNVFTSKVMEQYLSKDNCQKLNRIISQGLELDRHLAKDVAEAMKNWSVDRGATHYAHWFVPLSGMTAEKHNSFLIPRNNGGVELKLPLKSLITGEESDASSFPSGGLRSTFEARGITKWDYTSPAFLKEDDSGIVLCIPTTFTSHNGISLDKKQPLMSSCKALNAAGLEILELFGDTSSTSVSAMVGAEQEYFLIDQEMFRQRKDLVLTGRTLFGSNTAKTQDMENHYLGSLDEKVAIFMSEVDQALWKLGILSKTKHNESAPRQYELAPFFEEVNLACDHNQLTMEILKRVARKNGFECLLHEKPFRNINGSGKHNNWSIRTDTGINLVSPGKTTAENARFLTILCAVLTGINKHKDLLKASVMTASNDHRLSGFEAPPAIVSVYLGDQLTKFIETFIDHPNRKNVSMEDFKLPRLGTRGTDRNRTSPMAFLGNRFEFRMLGSASSMAVCNTVLNTIVADEIFNITSQLKNSKNFYQDLYKILAKNFKAHFNIIYNGNGYSDEWGQEAEARGISSVNNAPESFRAFIAPASVKLLSKYSVYNENELLARYKIKTDKYIKWAKIETRTLLEIVHSQILPACMKYSGFLANNINALKQVDASVYAETHVLKKIVKNVDNLYKNSEILQKNLDQSNEISDLYKKAKFFHEIVLDNMRSARDNIDDLEKIVDRNLWGIPTYTDILHRD